MFGIDKGEATLPGQWNIVRSVASPSSTIDNGIEFVQMTFRDGMKPGVLTFLLRRQILKLGNQNRGSVVGTARGMMWGREQPLTRHFEMLNPLLLNNPAYPFGPIASSDKAQPTACFFSIALPLVYEEYLENVSGEHRVGCNAHEAATLLSPNLEARREKGRFVFD
jgi:hypothetical protein